MQDGRMLRSYQRIAQQDHPCWHCPMTILPGDLYFGGVAMNLRTFKKWMHQELQALAERKPYVMNPESFSRTDLWYLMLVTDRGRKRLIPSGDVGRDFFYADPVKDSPWGKYLTSLKPNQKR